MNLAKRRKPHNSVALTVVLTLIGSLAACTDSSSSSETTIAAAPTTTEVAPTTVSVAPETTAPETTAPETTAAPAVVTIDPDGIGEAKLGDEVEGVIAYFTTLFGPPTSDSGWIEPPSTCDPPSFRALNWPELYAVFAPWDALGANVAADPQFVYFAYGWVAPEDLTVPLATDRGLLIGDTVDRLLELYPEATTYDGSLGGGRFYLVSDDIVGPYGILNEVVPENVATIEAGDWPCADVR
ncbi:MAG: hypothetical protein ABL953_10335 [Ilumatobacteraceae bacterium]